MWPDYTRAVVQFIKECMDAHDDPGPQNLASYQISPRWLDIYLSQRLLLDRRAKVGSVVMRQTVRVVSQTCMAYSCD